MVSSVENREKTKMQTVDPTTAFALVTPSDSPPVYRPNVYESASEWGFILVAARADHGLQGDIGTQMYVPHRPRRFSHSWVPKQVHGRYGVGFILQPDTLDRQGAKTRAV